MDYDRICIRERNRTKARTKIFKRAADDGRKEDGYLIVLVG